MNVMSWLMVRLQDRKLAKKSTPGCKACDEERSAEKRRDRPFNHKPECHEKQADFRARLRKTEMLPIMSLTAVSFFPWSGSSAEEVWIPRNSVELLAGRVEN